MLESIWQDLRYAVRALWRTPSFTLTAVVSLGLGIGGNAAIFSLADALLFRAPAGVTAPDRLVDIGRTDDGEGFDTLSYPTYLDVRERARTLEAVAAYRGESDAVGLDGGTGAERVYAAAVSGNYFSVLGVPMHVGRGFTADDDRLDAAPVVVLTHALWQARFQADPAVVGRSIRLNGRPFTVVGVAPAGFSGHTIVVADMWVPLAIHRGALVAGRPQDLTARNATWLLAVGRLAPGITAAQARAEIETIGRQLQAQFPAPRGARGITLLPARVIPFDVDIIPRFVLLLFLLVGLILLIACANVGGMLLARGAARSREMAVRASLGSSRARVVRLLVTESLVLSGVGAAFGVAVALALVRLLRRIVPVFPVPVVIDFVVDWRVVGFCAALSIVTGIACGLLPSIAAARGSLLVAARGEPGGSRRHRLRQAFVMVQVATSVLLVVTALLLGRSLANAVHVDPGFAADGVEIASLDLRLGGYDEARGGQFLESLLDRLRALPAVEDVSASRIVPLSGNGLSLGELRPAGQASDARAVPARWNVVSPRFFETLRLPMASGRPFDRTDGGARDVAIVNETFARQAWPGVDAVGQTLRHTMFDENGRAVRERDLEVIGVARNARNGSLSEAPAPFIYVPLAQHYDPRMSVLIRTASTAAVVPALRRVLREMDPGLPLIETSNLRQTAQFGLVLQRAAAWVAGSVGLVGLLLAAVGIYGITAFNVARRTREIGIRIALGALRGQVVGMVVRQAVAMAAAGAVAGLVLAGVAAQFLTALLYGIAPLDPASFIGGAALFAALALIAALLPARRAATVNPVNAIRSE